MDSQADFDGGVCCVARADPMFFVPEDRMTCEYVELTDVEMDYIQNEELIAHVIQISADVHKVRVRVLPSPPLHCTCIELWDSFDACGVSGCGIWAGRRPPLGSSQAARSVTSER